MPDAPAGNSFWTWFFAKFPAFDSLRTYSLSIFRRDFIAGLTVAAVAVPQAMAYAQIVGLPVQYGLYTAIVMTAVGAIFDSSKQLINGPTNAISIATLSALAVLDIKTDEARIAAAVLMALMIGVFQTGIALLRLGDLTRYISHAVIVGFTAGAAVLLILDQLKNVLGLKAQGDPHDHFLVRLWLTLRQVDLIQPHAVTVGLGVVAFVLALGWVNRRFKWRIPELLLAVILAAAVVWATGLDKKQTDSQGVTTRSAISIVGTIPRALPSFQTPEVNWSNVRKLSGNALAIALLGLLEAIAMAKAIAARTGDKPDMNQQCLSEGLANIAGSFFQCYPGSGSLTRSAINHQAGGATQWSGVISAIAVAATVLVFAPLAYYIPKAALAGILFVSALRMVDAHKLAFHMRVTKMDAVIVLATAIAAVAVSIEFCILIGTFVSFLIYLPRAARIGMTELVPTPDGMIRERIPNDPRCSRLILFSVEGELYFGSSTELESELDKIEDRVAEGGVKAVVLRVKYARNLDGVCLDVLERFDENLKRLRVVLILCGVRSDVMQVIRNAGWDKRLGPERVFPEGDELWSSTLQAVDQAYALVGEDRCATCPLRATRPAEARSWNYMI